jgi:glycosyltransferase involved in cell wall biosynthesis
MWTTSIFAATAGLFTFWGLFVCWHLRWVRRLPTMNALAASQPPNPNPLSSAGSATAGADRLVRCSVVIAARDEAARIEKTVRQLLQQRGVTLELIVIDDRSTDGTGQILQRLAQEDDRIQFKRVDVLPDGWLGKCHACHLGARAASGEWLLFTDGDCWLQPDVIARAVRVAERAAADHLTLVSGFAQSSPGLRAAHLLFIITLANWFSAVNRDRPKSFMGIGAFNLVRAAAYQACGGYEALRLTVVDDMKLGLLLRRAGRRTRAFLGSEDVECHWGNSVWSMIKIMEKNYFAAIDYRLDLVIVGGLFVVGTALLLAWGLFSGTIVGWIAALSPCSLIVPSVVLARRLRWPAWSAIAVPFMMPLFFYTLLNSTLVTLRRGGIRWRETFYPLKDLRAGNVQ